MRQKVDCQVSVWALAISPLSPTLGKKKKKGLDFFFLRPGFFFVALLPALAA